MYIFELSILTAAGIVVAFGLGFFAGMGYQITENRAEIKKIHRQCENEIKSAYRKAEADVEKAYKQAESDYKKAYYLGMKHQREATQEAVEREWRELIDNLGQPDNFKIGGF